jgi:excisionase family DNA binding protein
MAPKPLLTAEDVAEMLGVPTDYVYALARDDRIPHVRLGRYRRFREESIERWIAELEQGRVASSSNGPAVR